MNQLFKKFHFIGVGGMGMSALAQILLDQKNIVTGSDLSFNDRMQQLMCEGAQIFQGHAAKHIAPGTTVVFNSLIQTNNPEYEEALRLQCQILHRSELLALLMGEKKPLAIAGTHGKTTTSSLLAFVLIKAGFDPSFAIGGLIAGQNGKSGKGVYFVAEADESDGSFLKYLPAGAIVTNIEKEHLEYYKNEAVLQQAFQKFICQVQNDSLFFYCGDDLVLGNLADSKGTSYGFEPHNQLRIVNFRQEGWSCSFDLHFENTFYPSIQLALIGKHNALNAAAVFGLSLRLGVKEEYIRFAFQNFPGVGRRCEKKGESAGILFLDDYGHHPTEIAKTVSAIKHAIEERRLVVVFQPHRYTRTRDLLEDFCCAFEMADLVCITDIYPAFEKPIEGIDPQTLLAKIRNRSTVPAVYISKEKLVEELGTLLHTHDVLLTLGAGDITLLHQNLFEKISPKKLVIGLIFGGLSCEHEISVRSARSVSQWLNQNLYEIRYFGIDKQGRWIWGKEAKEILEKQTFVQSSHAVPLLHPFLSKELENCDLYMPILHGSNGEDGTIQGFFEMLDKPYAGPDYRTAALCMNKVLTKKVVATAGVKTPKDITFGWLKWLDERSEILENLQKNLTFPVFVKPVHLGSSIGITPVQKYENLAAAIDLAFSYDSQVMVEEGKTDCRELEFAVIGNSYSFSVRVPAPGEKLAQGEFVDYEKKYSQKAVSTTITPNLSDEVEKKGRELALRAYEAIGCTGLARVDFLLDREGEYWLFEINAIPGLQQLSLFPKIWNREGVLPEKLMDRLIVLGMERHRKKKRHFKCLGF